MSKKFTHDLEGLLFGDRDSLRYAQIRIVDAGSLEESPVGRAQTFRTQGAEPSVKIACGGDKIVPFSEQLSLYARLNEMKFTGSTYSQIQLYLIVRKN